MLTPRASATSGIAEASSSGRYITAMRTMETMPSPVTELELAGVAAEFADHEILPPRESERGQLRTGIGHVIVLVEGAGDRAHAGEHHPPRC